MEKFKKLDFSRSLVNCEETQQESRKKNREEGKKSFSFLHFTLISAGVRKSHFKCFTISIIALLLLCFPTLDVAVCAL